ncbi:hypothetical protein ACLOJK_036284 [Asimina triloba]
MKPTVVYPLLATVFLVFLVSSRKPPVGPKGLNRRLAHLRAAFDPLIEKLEKRAEGGAVAGQAIQDAFSNGLIGKHSDSAAAAHVEEFLTDEGEFNVTERLIYLFPLLDRWPKDGVVSLEELEHWIIGLAMDRMDYRTEGEIKAHDKDGDGAITLSEYLSHLFEENKDMKEQPGRVAWWKERFVQADLDGDGSLNYSEYKDFIYPEDSGNLRVQQWVRRDKLREMDLDGDGRLNFQEFRHHAYELYKINLELENDIDEDPYYIPTAEEKFAELDKNKDRLRTQYKNTKHKELNSSVKRPLQ